MEDLYNNNKRPRDCDMQGPPHLKCQDCKNDIVCSQVCVSECEAKLFCEVTQKLSWEIKHTHCLRDLERLVALTNAFLVASANKEAMIAKYTSD